MSLRKYKTGDLLKMNREGGLWETSINDRDDMIRILQRDDVGIVLCRLKNKCNNGNRDTMYMCIFHDAMGWINERNVDHCISDRINDI